MIKQRVLNTDPQGDLASFASALGRLVIQCSFVEYEIRAIYCRLRGYEGRDIVSQAFDVQISKVIESLGTEIAGLLDEQSFKILAKHLQKFEDVSVKRNEWVHSVLRIEDGVWRAGYIPRAKKQPDPPYIDWRHPCVDSVEEAIFDLEQINLCIQSVKLRLRPLPMREK